VEGREKGCQLSGVKGCAGKGVVPQIRRGGRKKADSEIAPSRKEKAFP